MRNLFKSRVHNVIWGGLYVAIVLKVVFFFSPAAILDNEKTLATRLVAIFDWPARFVPSLYQ